MCELQEIYTSVNGLGGWWFGILRVPLSDKPILKGFQESKPPGPKPPTETTWGGLDFGFHPNQSCESGIFYIC